MLRTEQISLLLLGPDDGADDDRGGAIYLKLHGTLP